MSIVQWNCRGYRGNFEDLKALIMNQRRPECICLQETFHGDVAPYPPRGYTLKAAQPVIQYQPHTRPSRGVITLIRQDIPYYHIPLNTQLEAIALRINLDGEVTICNIYITPNETLTTNQLQSLIDQLPRPFILLGDLNARSTVWGDTETNPHGRSVEDLLLASDVCVMNTGSPTHIHIQTGTESCIDMALSSPDLICDFTWRTLDDCFNSDHLPIVISKVPENTTNDNPNLSYNLDKADWVKYRRLTITPNEFFNENENIDILVENLNNIIHNAAIDSIPVKKASTKYPIPWWNDKCHETQKERKKALRKYRRTKSIADKTALNRATAIARKTKREARRDCWKHYISTINADTPISKHWIKINKIKGKYRGHRAICISENNSTTTNQTEVANILANHFSETSSNSYYSDTFNRLREQAEQTEINFLTTEKLDYNDPITKSELEDALQKCQNKAPGEDRIHYSMVKNLSQSAKQALLFIYNQIYSKGVFPALWSQSLLIPIVKPGKPENTKSSYRPIALTSSLCKLLEKIINARLVHTLESTSFFSPYQYGFRKARSTIDPLTKIQTDIYRSFKNKCHTVAVFFDIQKAYDTTWKHHIIKTIYNAGIRGNMGIFIRNFLSNRSLKVKINKSISNAFPQQQGVPQGSVMSVTLFGVAINSIIDGISSDIGRSLFVDDLAIYFSSSSVNTIERQLQIAIAKIQEFTSRTGFKISAEKTVAIHFHRKRGLQQEPDLNIDGIPIKFEERAKFLGMIFDSRLYWHEHIKYLRNKCLKSLTIIKCLSRMKWGADRQSLLRLYRATTRAQLDYGCQIYASAPERHLKKLDAVHHQGIRLYTGAFRSSPIPSLLAEAS